MAKKFFGGGVLAGLLNVVGTILTGGTLTLATFLVPAAITIGAGFLLSKLAPSVNPQGLDVTGASAQTIRSSVLPERWILGRARVGGVLVWTHADGDYLHTIYALAAGPCDAIEEIWINGEAGGISVTGDFQSSEGASITLTRSRYAGTGDGDRISSGWLTLQGDRVHHFAARAYLSGGLYHTLPQNFSNARPLPWTSQHRLSGVAFIYVRTHQPDYGNDLDRRIWSNIPELTFLVRGLRFTWPGQQEEAWTENAAAIRYWWLTQRRGIPDDDIDEDLFQAAYDLCEQDVSLMGLENFNPEYPETVKRYSINGVITAGERVERVEANMDAAWAGYAVEFDGRYRFLPGAERPVSVSLGPGDIIDSPTFRPGPEQHERLNRITARISQSNLHDWTDYALERLDDSFAQSRDGEVLHSDLGNLQFVADPVQGLNLLAIHLRRERAVAQVDITVRPGNDFGNLTIAPGDIVSLTLDEWELNAERYFVLASEVAEDWSVKLSLVEHPTGIYADTLVLPELGGVTFFPAPDEDDSAQPITAPPSNLSVNYSELNSSDAVNPNADFPLEAVFSWSASSNAQGYEVQFQPSSVTAPVEGDWAGVGQTNTRRALWTLDAGGDFDMPGTYRWWVRAVRFQYQPSAAVEGPGTIKVVRALPAPTIESNYYYYYFEDPPDPGPDPGGDPDDGGEGP